MSASSKPVPSSYNVDVPQGQWSMDVRGGDDADYKAFFTSGGQSFTIAEYPCEGGDEARKACEWYAMQFRTAMRNLGAPPERTPRPVTPTDAVHERPPLTHVAIRFRGKVWSLPSPYRHHHIIHMIIHLDPAVETVDSCGDDQGFLDASGRYLTRRQAEVSAHLNGQLKAKIRGVLTSEDVW